MTNIERTAQLILSAESNKETLFNSIEDIPAGLEQTHAGMVLALSLLVKGIKDLPTDGTAHQAARALALGICQIAEANDVLKMAEVA